MNRLEIDDLADAVAASLENSIHRIVQEAVDAAIAEAVSRIGRDLSLYKAIKEGERTI